VGEEQVESLSFANFVHSTKLKTFLDKPLIVEKDLCSVIDYDPRDSSVDPMVSLDKANSSDPQYPINHSYFDFSDIILRRKFDQIINNTDMNIR
jgi:hypothetical protein